jgi:NAD(P)-dependent dehydrogenase (short-subunit alcohol dehydrogenase family)
MTESFIDLPQGYCLITGASSGIGCSMALQLSKNYKLVLSGRNIERLCETKNNCFEPEKHLIWKHDLTDIEQVANSLTKFIFEKNIAIDSLIHCAGIFKVMAMKSINHRVTYETLNTNFVSVTEIISTLLKKKINKGRLKNIIFISSIASKFGARGLSMYCASKGALDSLMKSLAMELAPTVRVNSVLPGGINTKMTDRIFNDQEMAKKMDQDYPLGIGYTEDIVGIVEFLMSERARWITGQQIIVDGGRTTNISL